MEKKDIVKKWRLFRTTDKSFRISEDLRTSYEGTKQEALEYIKENVEYKNIEVSSDSITFFV